MKLVILFTYISYSMHASFGTFNDSMWWEFWKFWRKLGELNTTIDASFFNEVEIMPMLRGPHIPPGKPSCPRPTQRSPSLQPSFSQPLHAKDTRMITTMMIRRPVSFFVVVIIIKLFIFPGEFFYMKIFLFLSFFFFWAWMMGLCLAL